ncbi:hypothetical protein BKA63DRAFT_466043 [Paraphoma chrysanthemicola]|nr:hypothetical protein BKA63DRAFT_466043 [Paraphoma chrysanthemicola]
MVSNKMPQDASTIGDKPHVSIPSRTSSMSRTSLLTNSTKKIATTQPGTDLDDNDRQPHFLRRDWNQKDSAAKPSKMTRRSASCSATSRKQPQASKVQRWAGLTRSVETWDGLRKDPELWVPDGDLHVHLYARGASRRGASFCVPSRALRQRNCGTILKHCYAQVGTQQLHSFSMSSHGSKVIQLYIPAPDHTSREDSFRWHLTTRNFFAYVLGLPLVGHHMGQSFVDLVERMMVWRSSNANNHQDFLEYADNQGYRDLVECTDYALANLYFAEWYKLREVWIDAFAHCVGMSDSLALSPEYAPVSQLTKALITRAYLELDMHLGRVSNALQTFLEEDFSPAHLGLAEGARSHLRRFQRFLHQFYAEKYGYWPPPKSASPFPKALYKSMFYDFQSLYELLVDKQSSTDLGSQRPASGGICVLQNVCHFDKRHKFTAQPHPLPLLPDRSQPRKTVRSLSSASNHKKIHDNHAKSAALFAATNSLEPDMMKSKVVQAYMEFERTYSTNSTHREEKVTAVDARKVRWLVIYGTLQYLQSALRAPSGVRDTESAEYPLCCLIAGQSTWNAETPAATPSVKSPSGAHQEPEDYFGANAEPAISIQPDCHREDYFTSQPPTRRNSTMLISSKTSLPTRQGSTRSFAPLASLSARSSRRNSTILKPTSHCAIIVHGYGDGLNQTASHTSTSNITNLSATKATAALTDTSTITHKVATSGHTRTRTPLLHSFQLDQVTLDTDAQTLNDLMSRSDSTSSMCSSVWTDGGSAASSKSSADSERQQFYKTSNAAHSGLLGGLVAVDAPLSQMHIHPALRTPPIEQEQGFQFDFGDHSVEATTSTCTTSTYAVGAAYSAPPSPPLQAAPWPHIKSSPRTMSLTSEKTIHAFQPRATNTAPTVDALRKKNRASDVFSGLISTPGELRDRYSSAIKRLETTTSTSNQYGDMCNGSKPVAHPPAVTKTSHAAKTPSLRNRIWHDDAKDEKTERRKSSFWRR